MLKYAMAIAFTLIALMPQADAASWNNDRVQLYGGNQAVLFVAKHGDVNVGLVIKGKCQFLSEEVIDMTFAYSTYKARKRCHDGNAYIVYPSTRSGSSNLKSALERASNSLDVVIEAANGTRKKLKVSAVGFTKAASTFALVTREESTWN